MMLTILGSYIRSLNGVRASLVLATALCGLTGAVQANVYDEPVVHEPIPLLDEDGTHVLTSGKSYSSKQSCGGCHDYDSITHSYHFETGRDEASDDFGAKRGLSQLVSPGYYGGYNCMGSNNPDSLAKKSNSSAHNFGDKGSAGLVMRCESCHSGGGWMEKDRNGIRYDKVDPASVTEFDGDYYNRGTDENNHPADLLVVSQWDWKKSGVVENNCFKCHADLTNLTVIDPTIQTRSASTMVSNVRRGVLIDQGHFRESNTAILEVLNLNTTGIVEDDQTLVTFNRADQEVVEHDGTVTPADGVITDKEVVFDETTGEPLITWNADAFTDGQVAIPMLRFPANDNCMACHRTSNSRRGFYGFGEDAVADLDDDGLIIEDYQDDVHKGKTWREANGEERTIENCNVCHSRNYFNPLSSSADVDANHAFLKGNSDMDVHNDLDNNPNAKSCEYCHEESPLAAELANPSGDADMLSAHQKRWTLGGDMYGYPADTLERITQTHLDVVSCQACHITDKAVRGTPFEPMFRYREAENGKRTIVPYKPKPRYFWKDNNSGVVLNKTQRDSIYREIRDVDGNLTGGEIFDPETEETLATVTARISHGSVRYGDPETYDDFVGLKNAYDKLLQMAGVENPDAVLVWSEINQYLISHNTRPAVSSVQCEECHNTKQDGSISSLVSVDGIFGVNNSYEITTVLDPRLVNDGIIVFDYPYMKMDEAGVVTANVSDILSHSMVDPSMSALRSATASVATAAVQQETVQQEIALVIADAGITNPDDVTLLADLFTNSYAYLYQANYGDDALRDVAMMGRDSMVEGSVFEGYTLQIGIADDTVAASAAGAGLGGLVAGAEVFSLQVNNASGIQVSIFTNDVLVKLPYSGSNSDPQQIGIITSTDGATWTVLPADDILIIRPQTELAEGYVVFQTDHFSYYAVIDTTLADSSADTTSDGSASSGGSSGGVDFLFLLFGLVSLLAGRNARLLSLRD